MGKFNYWKSTKKLIPQFINTFISDIFSDYTGCLNIETIGDTMIECHLRMGDIDLFPTLDILNGIIHVYNNNKYDWNINLKDVYFFPIWFSKNEIYDEYNTEFQQLAKDKLDELLINNDNIYEFNFDNPTLSGPSSEKRIMWFTCGDKQYGELFKDSICKTLFD